MPCHQESTNPPETLQISSQEYTNPDCAVGLVTGDVQEDDIWPERLAEPPKTPNIAPPIVEIDVKESPRRRNLEKLAEKEPMFDLGYDSDGELAPMMELLSIEGEQDYEEFAAPSAPKLPSDNTPPFPISLETSSHDAFQTCHEDRDAKASIESCRICHMGSRGGEC